MAMSTHQTIAERLTLRAGVPPTNATSATGPWIDLAGFGRFGMHMVATQVSAGESITLTLRVATDSSGTDAQDFVSQTVTNDEATAQDMEAFVEGQAARLPAGARYAQASLSTTAPAVDMAAGFIAADAHYRP